MDDNIKLALQEVKSYLNDNYIIRYPKLKEILRKYNLRHVNSLATILVTKHMQHLGGYDYVATDFNPQVIFKKISYFTKTKKLRIDKSKSNHKKNKKSEYEEYLTDIIYAVRRTDLPVDLILNRFGDWFTDDIKHAIKYYIEDCRSINMNNPDDINSLINKIYNKSNSLIN